MKNKKDWIGNKNTPFSTNGCSNHSEQEREKNDYYATDPSAVDDLLKYEKFDNIVWEPACGEGHLSKRLKENGVNVISTELYDRGYGVERDVDFLKTGKPYGQHIITNPPYKYAKEFVEKAIDLLKDKNGSKIAMFLKLTFLEGQKRKELFQKYPPKTVYVFSKRKECALNGYFKEKSDSAVAYAWFVWEIGYKGECIVKWI